MEGNHSMWIDNSCFYQIYPLGFCGAPRENDGILVPRILKVLDWVEHLRRLNIDAVYFSPIFQSDRHGYDTRDYRTLDCRLGSNEDFAQVCRALHAAGIRVVLDGVFNHVGRGFWAFRDVLLNRENSPYLNWFTIRLDSDNGYGDGLSYEGWEGHYELVKLNLQNPQVQEYLFSCIRFWVEQFDIDGLRLDVAYSLDRGFLERLRGFTRELKEQFALIGEVLFGDYNLLVNEGMLHSCTNYECYKGLFSSCNEHNLFEISYSLNRQFGPETWCLYRGKHLVSFVDNHDVTRIASQLKEERHLPLIYGLLYSMPGIPCLYYGSEWGLQGKKEDGDDALRPCPQAPQWTSLTQFLSRLGELRREHPALTLGDYRNVYVANEQLVFSRTWEKECIYVGINLSGQPGVLRLDQEARATDLLTGQSVVLNGQTQLPPFGFALWQLQ